MADLDDVISRNIKRFREERGLKQADLAAAAGVAQSTVSKWEDPNKGEGEPGRKPNAVNLQALARAVGRPIGDFYEERPPPAPPMRVRPRVVVDVIGVIPPMTDEERAAFIDEEMRKIARLLRDRLSAPTVQIPGPGGGTILATKDVAEKHIAPALGPRTPVPAAPSRRRPRRAR